MVFFPKAKINIGLRITGKRQDGYHDIETVFYPVNLYDVLEFVVSSELPDDVLSVSGIITGGLNKDNLVMKGVSLMREKYSFPPLRIHLHKTIPIGAGLGGGSSDAAGVITGINKYFRLNIDDHELEALALHLGSDCPFFIKNVPSLARGRGEILKQMDCFLSGYNIVIINPGINISTREAYLNCRPVYPATDLSELVLSPVSEWKSLIFNDFENHIFGKYPQIGEIKASLYESGASYSSMSGSGSSVYGLFGSVPVIPERLKDFVVYNGTL
jgi:4-diphosphocytidyl-2-C-methyl-D-erythritol kinase